MTNEELITNELKEQYPEIFNRICKDLDIIIVEKKISNETNLFIEVKQLKYEYEEIFYEICTILNIPEDVKISKLSENQLEDIIQSLKYEYRWVWKEL